jgi:hypothetical protein
VLGDDRLFQIEGLLEVLDASLAVTSFSRIRMRTGCPSVLKNSALKACSDPDDDDRPVTI